MKTNHESSEELVELGSVTADTQGGDGVLIEGFVYMPKTGITAD
jgi:predicted alpha-1,6-mannanase (GH76 family)